MATDSPSSPGPELSSITTALSDITRRVTAIADRSQGTELDWLSSVAFRRGTVAPRRHPAAVVGHHGTAQTRLTAPRGRRQWGGPGGGTR